MYCTIRLLSTDRSSSDNPQKFISCFSSHFTSGRDGIIVTVRRAERLRWIVRTLPEVYTVTSVGISNTQLTQNRPRVWRATSSAITVIPVIVAPIDFLLATRLRKHDINSCENFERTALLTLDLVMTILRLLFIY